MARKLTISYEDQVLSNDKIFVKDSLRPDARVDIRQGIGWHVKGCLYQKTYEGILDHRVFSERKYLFKVCFWRNSTGGDRILIALSNNNWNQNRINSLSESL